MDARPHGGRRTDRGRAKQLTTAQLDRALGVLLGQASGDALGVPYEFGPPLPPDEVPEMLGGGLGDFAPGEWSDDTAMATAVLDGLLAAEDPEGRLDAIAQRFVDWYAAGPPDVGVQTSAVLARVRRRLEAGEAGAGRIATEEAHAYAAGHPHSAGNGALMRTSPVALAHLHDRETCAATARRVAVLTHADPLAADSCVLWSEAIRVAVLEGVLDVTEGLDLLPLARRDQWAGWIREAEERPAAAFTPNGFTVSALQAAWSAILHTPPPPDDPGHGRFGCQHLAHALHAAIRVGHDTDTVAAIAGGLLGARWGATAVPWRWRRAVHGWPGADGRDLLARSALLVQGGPDRLGWPTAPDVVYRDPAAERAVPHPHDPGVLLGTHRSRGHGATAVVSLCRVGREQACFEGAEVVVESRLVDAEELAANPHLHFELHDAADAVRGLRAEGHTVLVHCVGAHQRTPSVAVAYSRLLGHPAAEAQAAVRAALDSTRGHGVVWDAAAEIGPPDPGATG